MREEELKEMKQKYEKITMREDAYKKMRQRMDQAKKENRMMKKKNVYKGLAAVAAAMAVVVALPNTSSTVANAMQSIPVFGEFVKVVTFRDYQYDSDKKTADVSVPEVVVDADANTENAEKMKESTEQINAEIQKISDQWIKEFKKDLAKDGYKDMQISSEVIKTTDDYFTLKLTCTQTEASGYEENHYFTLDRKTGKQLKLADLYSGEADYKKRISDNIKKQMREQMKADENVSYWLDDKDLPEMNFTEITEDTAFYINEDGKLVICFNEGDVAPMYMGAVQFVIEE